MKAMRFGVSANRAKRRSGIDAKEKDGEQPTRLT